jgi:hypothetical protein
MGLNTKTVAHFVVVLFAFAFVHAAAGADADDRPAPLPATATNSAAGSDTRYGLFDWLDHRSAYTQEVFPEPFLVEDMAFEDNELELTWLHTKGNGQQSDLGTAEFQKGFGLLTLQVDVPYGRNVSAYQTVEGVGNIDFGARYPLYQFVSANRFVDTTFGAALEGGFPVHFAFSRNADLEPQVFNDLKLGDHFTIQSVLGYSTLFSGGDEGGLRTFEYGCSFAYAFPHRELPLPGVQQFIPMFELSGETGLNNDEAGQNSLEGDIGFRIKLNPVGELQPGLGFAYVFPVDSGAREELHWGFVVSMIFEF